MTPHCLALALCLGASAAMADDTRLSPFTRPDTEWHLARLNGAAFEGESTIVFPEPGRVAGKALCNRFMGTADWTPEALRFGPLGLTMMACIDAEAEKAVTDALADVVAGGIAGDALVLTLGSGGSMLYRPAP